MLAERDSLFERHPKTRFVAAHLGWLGNDLDRLGRLLDEMPNVYTEVGAVLYDLGRQPRGAHDFLVKYQDRVLFGKDAFEPTEYPYYWRVFETADEYFDYYRDYHAFWKLYGLDLPDVVLKKLYYQNALRITPGLPGPAGPTERRRARPSAFAPRPAWQSTGSRAGPCSHRGPVATIGPCSDNFLVTRPGARPSRPWRCSSLRARWQPDNAAAGAESANVQQASQFIRDGKPDEALAAVRRELQADPDSTQAASLLDTLGHGAEAQPIFQRAIDAAPDAQAKANAQRAMAMSYAFEGDCANTVKFEQMVIDYWKTREPAEPQNAFYQEGEMADEGARVCVDSGDLDTGEHWYRMGYEMGVKEPGNQTHPKSLWDYRLAHALGRIAARRGNAAEARRQVAAARQALDSDPEMAAQQERFFPYLTGYVALYLGDLKTAEADLTRTVDMQGNQSDPFMRCLLGMTYEKLGRAGEAKAAYEQAFLQATAHNPPAAFARRFAREKLGR